MSKLTTKVAIVLDKSGSMQKRRQQAIDGYNEQVQQFKLNSKEQEILCSLVTFNGSVEEHLWNQPADKLQEATTEDYNPVGATAMRDAIAFVINKWLAEPDYSDPNVTHLVIVITDGESYDDKTYNHQDKEAMARYRELIEGCEATGRWSFTMMGCAKEYLIQLAKETGIPVSNFAEFSAKSITAYDHANKALGRRTDNFLKKRARGMSGAALNANYMSDSAEVACFVPPAEQTVDRKHGGVLLGGVPLGEQPTEPTNVWPQVVNKVTQSVTYSTKKD